MFFTRTSGNALPLIALSFHGVKISLKTGNRFESDRQLFFAADQSWFATGTAGPTIRTAKSKRLFEPTSNSTKGANIRTTLVFQRQANDAQRVPFKHFPEHTGEDIPAVSELNMYHNEEVQAKHVQVNLQVGYVYLGVAERNKFAEAAFEILIDQVQEADGDSLKPGQKTVIDNLGINHCVQELVWAVTHDAAAGARPREALDFSGPADAAGNAQEPVVSVQLKLNNSKRLTHLDGDDVPGAYFRQLDPYMHHTRIPDNVYAYSFAITPESNQPSGSCNFSRIDNASFEIVAHKSMINPKLHMYARNWNVFRISLGLGGLVWAS